MKTVLIVILTLAAALSAPAAQFNTRFVRVVTTAPKPAPVVKAAPAPAPVALAAIPQPPVVVAAPAFVPLTKAELINILTNRAQVAELTIATAVAHGDSLEAPAVREAIVRSRALREALELAELLR
jgi:hypothetical protein